MYLVTLLLSVFVCLSVNIVYCIVLKLKRKRTERKNLDYCFKKFSLYRQSSFLRSPTYQHKCILTHTVPTLKRNEKADSKPNSHLSPPTQPWTWSLLLTNTFFTTNSENPEPWFISRAHTLFLHQNWFNLCQTMSIIIIFISVH